MGTHERRWTLGLTAGALALLVGWLVAVQGGVGPLAGAPPRVAGLPAPAPVEVAAGGPATPEPAAPPATRRSQASGPSAAPRAFTVDGVVTWGGSGPLPVGVRVEALTAAGQLGGSAAPSPTGEFRLALTAGAWSVQARAAASRSAARTLHIGLEGAAGEPLELALCPTGALVLCLVEPDGAAAAPLAVRVRHPETGEELVRSSEADGCVRFEGLLAGTHRVAIGHAEHPLVPAFEVEVDGALSRPAPIALPERGRLRVRVQDAAGRPVVGARLHAFGHRGGAVEDQTDSAGAALLDGLPLGPARVQASSGQGHADRAVVVSAGDGPEVVLSLRSRK